MECLQYSTKRSAEFLGRDVVCWHFSDMPAALCDVRFQGQSAPPGRDFIFDISDTLMIFLACPDKSLNPRWNRGCFVRSLRLSRASR